MIVMKFGGSCLDKANDIKRMVEIVKSAERNQPKVVLSAFKGVTDELIKQANSARDGSFDLVSIEKKHRELLTDLPESAKTATETRVDRLLKELRTILTTVSTRKELSPPALDEIVSYGERLAVQIAGGYLSAAHLEYTPLSDIDAGLLTDSTFGNATILDESYQLVRDRVGSARVPIIAGFFGRDRSGRIATLGRGGTDYVAAFIASALHCNCVLLKDVEGIMTADPKIVRNARLVSNVDYLTAIELAHYGSKVVFEKAIAPAMKARIPLKVTSFLKPNGGTLISESGQATAVSSMKDIALIRAQDMANADLIGHIMHEGAYRNDILLTTHTGQDEIYIVTRDGKADGVAEIIRKLAADTQVNMTKELSLVALTGCRSEPTKVREVLQRENIETRLVSLSPSERSVCSVLNREYAEHAVRALHDHLITQL